MMRKDKITNGKNDSPQKVFDVSRPGRISPAATSRPVIVGHKPQVKDPMMSGRTDDRPLLDSNQKVTLAVPTEDGSGPNATVAVPPAAVPVAQAKPMASPEAERPSAEVPTPVEANVAEPADNPMAQVTENAISTPPASTDTSAPETETIPEVSETPNATPVAPAEPISPVMTATNATTGVIFDETPVPPDPMPQTPHNADAKPLPVLSDEPTDMATQAKVVVSHHNHSDGWGKFFVTFVVLAVIAIVIVDVLLDSGLIIKNGIPHTNFF